MDIYFLKIILLIFVLKFNILFINNGVYCHEGSRKISKFESNVLYYVLNSRKHTANRNFKRLNKPKKDVKYCKTTISNLKGLSFIMNYNSVPSVFPSYNPYNHSTEMANGYDLLPKYSNKSPDYHCDYHDNVYGNCNSGNINKNMALFMSRKVRYGYRYNAEKVRQKGTVRSKIYFDMWKDKNPYYVIHKFLYENDPDNANFNYDIDLARKVKCRRNIFAHYKKDNRLRFFWYASRKNTAKGPCSRYINYALDRNEFRFSKLYSFFHILPYVHEHYKNDPRYIYFMNRFLSRHGRVAAFKRMNSGNNGTTEGVLDGTNSGLVTDDTTSCVDTGNDSERVDTNFQGNSGNSACNTGKVDNPIRYRRTISWKDMLHKAKAEEEELFKRISTEPIVVDLGNGRTFTVKKDGFKVYGEYYSKIDKKNRKTPYDINSPFLKTKHSSRRRRYREKIPLDPSLRCKTRRERILKNAEKRDIRTFIQKYIKQKPKSS